jgi:O-antigen/teichoic acid export membrane protein
MAQLKAGTTSLRTSIFKAFSWIVVGHFASLALRFFGTVILSRIFTPDVFGVLAIVTTVQVVTHLFTDIGISQAIIQSPNGQNRTFLDTAWTVQVLRGGVIWGLGVLAAGALFVSGRMNWLPLESVYSFPELPIILVIACFSSVILGFQTTKVMVANRNLNIQIVTLIDLFSQAFALGFTVAVGLLTRSIWSYIAAGLLSCVLSVFLSHIFLRGPANRFRWNSAALKDLSHFGRWVFVSSAVGGVASNGDRIVLGGMVTPAMLGLYSIASNLVAVVDGVASRIFGIVALPALSSISRSQPERFASLLSRIRFPIDACMLGLSGMLFATSHLIVAVLYDPRYNEAGSILQILSLSLIFARYNLAQSAYIALGLPRYLTVLNFTKLVSLFTLIPVLFYLKGPQGTVYAIAFHMVPVVMLTFYFNAQHRLNDIRLELAVLGFWPIGWIVGGCILKLARELPGYHFSWI